MGLYVLAGLSLVALLAQVVVGGDSGPRRVEVAAGRQPRARVTTTVATPTITEPPTSTVPPFTTAPPATGGEPVPTLPRARGGGGGGGGRGGGGGGGSSPPPVGFEPPPPTALQCRNSRDPACGQFRWDPDPGGNADLEITVAAPQAVKAGETVTFTVTVRDPDHIVTGNCTSVRGAQGEGFPCSPPDCPPAYGPWTPPPRQAGSRTFTFTGTYGVGTHEVAFTFHTDRDGCQDPYGSFRTQRVAVQVTPAESGE